MAGGLIVCISLLACFTNAEVSPDLKKIIQGVTPYFEENLKRAFQNEAIHRANMRSVREQVHTLDNVLTTIESNVIQLKNLTLTKRPDFRLNHLSINLELLHLNVTINLGDLRVEGDYEVTNMALQKVLPVTQIGKIGVTLEKVVATGRATLYLVEDSFVMAHYDLDFKPQDINVRVTYSNVGEGEVPIESEVSQKHLDDTIAVTFWPNLREKIMDMLHHQFGATITEYSVTELLSDEDEELREHARKITVKANRVFDSLLCEAKGHIVKEDNRVLKTKGFNVTFNGKQGGKGAFEAEAGYIQDLSTLTRVNDASLYENEKELIVYGTLRLGEFKHGFESYKAEFQQTSVEGNIKSTIYRNKITLKVVLTKSQDQCVPQLERIQIEPDYFNTDVSGLASLSWLKEKVEAWVVGNLRDDGVKALEERIKTAFTEAFRTTDCVALLAD